MTIDKAYKSGGQLVVASANKETSELTGLDRSSSFKYIHIFLL